MIAELPLPGQDGFRDQPPLTVVTGASGWLGRSLVEVLVACGRRVRTLVQPQDAAAVQPQADSTVEGIRGDIRDPAAVARLLEGAEGGTVFHAAAVIHPHGRTRDFFDVNVGGTALVADHARRAGARRLVHVSSNSPFGAGASPDDVFDEGAPYAPGPGYGRSKMEAEQLLWRVLERGDLEVVIVRPPWFYGPGQPARQLRFLSLVRRGLFPLVGTGDNRRSLAYVDHLVQGLIRAELRDDANGRAYWIADPEAYSMRQIVATARRALAAEGLPVRPGSVRVPALVPAAAALGDRALQAAGRYSQPLHVLSELGATIACVTERAQVELGYRPVVSLEEGMRRSVRDARARGHAL